MADEALPLTDEERAELEALRAEKAQRELRERAARERAELEELRASHASAERSPVQSVSRPQPRPSAEDQRIREARERGSKLMEPDDDLRMPLGQKIVLAVLGALAAIIVIMHFLVG